jgi:BirA family biotin operon repressor/biotin-[acetyl-CoA-carboxylase] ligase
MAFGTVVHRLAAVVSTNDAARDLARRGAPHGTAVLAEEQTGGRGTKGRRWHSPPGLGLYVSFLARFPADRPDIPLPLLPLAAGVAAAEAVEAASGIEVRLKWPNDLLQAGRKLGGVLVESVSAGSGPRFAVVGIGINVGHGEADFPEDLRSRATSLRLAAGRPSDGGEVFAALCRALDNWYNALTRGEAGSIVEAFENRSAFSPGERIRVTTASGVSRGTYRGLDARGRLLVGLGRRAGPVAFDDILGLEGE